MEPFPCTSCGLCCKLVHLDPSAQAAGLPMRSDGSCAHLDPASNKCTIYDKRPWFCDTRYARTHLRPKGLTDRQFVRTIADGCNALQRRFGVPHRFRVKIPGTAE